MVSVDEQFEYEAPMVEISEVWITQYQLYVYTFHNIYKNIINST